MNSFWRRALSLTCALACSLTLSLTCFAAEPASIDLESTGGVLDPGDSFYVLVNAENNPGFSALQFSITYDPELLTFIKAEKGSLLTSGAMVSINTDTIGTIQTAAISTQNIIGDGSLLVLIFEANQEGHDELVLSLMSLADSKLRNLDCSTGNIQIQIGDTQADTPSSAPSVSESDKETITEIPPAEESTSFLAFPDVSEHHWAYTSICSAVEQGLFAGMGDGRFAPDEQMTRAMFVSVLRKYANGTPTQLSQFNDVPADAWYAQAVAWASENGIVSGTDDGLFLPDVSITRGQLAVILRQLSGDAAGNSMLLNEYKDAANVPDWAKDGVSWAAEHGIISGRADGTLAVNAQATRAEAAVILMNFQKMMSNR